MLTRATWPGSLQRMVSPHVIAATFAVALTASSLAVPRGARCNHGRKNDTPIARRALQSCLLAPDVSWRHHGRSNRGKAALSRPSQNTHRAGVPPLVGVAG